jgi:hypothetical protein
VVAEERGHRAGVADGLLRQLVQLTGADPGPDGRGDGGEGLGHDQAGGAHRLQLGRALQLDHPAAPPL